MHPARHRHRDGGPALAFPEHEHPLLVAIVAGNKTAGTALVLGTGDRPHRFDLHRILSWPAPDKFKPFHQLSTCQSDAGGIIHHRDGGKDFGSSRTASGNQSVSYRRGIGKRNRDLRFADYGRDAHIHIRGRSDDSRAVQFTDFVRSTADGGGRPGSTQAAVDFVCFIDKLHRGRFFLSAVDFATFDGTIVDSESGCRVCDAVGYRRFRSKAVLLPTRLDGRRQPRIACSKGRGSVDLLLLRTAHDPVAE